MQKTMFIVEDPQMALSRRPERIAVPQDLTMTFAQALDALLERKLARTRKFDTREDAQQYLADLIQATIDRREQFRFPGIDTPGGNQSLETLTEFIIQTHGAKWLHDCDRQCMEVRWDTYRREFQNLTLEVDRLKTHRIVAVVVTV
jgi:hypothetical protein